ncbi:MAG: hypothetical protein AB4911_02055 [Oscillochloridaceae bacterium umkhey_bin13]
MPTPDPPSETTRTLPLLRLDHLWAILALSLIAGFISMAPTSPNDFWWHLRVGQIIATEGLPTTNMFAWGVPPETPFTYQSWLGQWLFFQLYQLGGLPLIVFTRNLLGAMTFALVVWEAQQRSGSWRLAALAVLLAAAMSINNFIIRTQNWSWLPFMLTLIILGSYTRQRLGPRWLVVLPVIMALWVNLHGAFVLGLLVAGAFVVGETLRRWLRDPYALPWYRLRPLYLAALAMLLATLLNPLGPGIFGYVGTILGSNQIQNLIIEWQPPRQSDLAGAAFYAGVLALLAAFGIGRRRPTLTDLLLVCGLLWQAFGGSRSVVWFGMAAMPILAQSLGTAKLAGDATPSLSRRERGAGTAANLAVVILLALGVIALQPWFKPYLPLPVEYQALFAPVPGAPQSFTTTTPVAAVAHLLAEPCSGQIFNEMGYGSYMAWALYPQARHFIDTRIELFPWERWQEYIAVTEGRDLAEFLDANQVGCVVLDQPLQPGLAAAMPDLSGWRQSFSDGRSEVWRRSITP